MADNQLMVSRKDAKPPRNSLYLIFIYPALFLANHLRLTVSLDRSGPLRFARAEPELYLTAMYV